jgi:hypothetical protein
VCYVFKGFGQKYGNHRHVWRKIINNMDKGILTCERIDVLRKHSPTSLI